MSLLSLKCPLCYSVTLEVQLYTALILFNPSMHLQAGREEGYEVDEDLAEQDAQSLFEVSWTHITDTLLKTQNQFSVL